MSSNQIDINKPSHDMEQLFSYAKQLDFGEVHIKIDQHTGLLAIVAIHDVTLGPALGGCRCIEYPSYANAFVDALRLARGMSYKAALCGIAHGGGKAVLVKPPVIKDRKAYFEVFGQFVNELGGRYITAMDSGTHTQDMDVISTQTPYVTCLSPGHDDFDDPAPYTAQGVLKGIQAAVKYKLGKDNLAGLTVALQGVGAVGYYLAKKLHQLGAKLIVTDVNAQAVNRCVLEFSALAVSPSEIYSVACDVFAPCAFGATINDASIPLLKTTIIAGAANNQLAENKHGTILQQQGILFAPDYLINAGGLIHAASTYAKHAHAEVEQKIENIYANLIRIFERADNEHLPTNEVADHLAHEIISEAAKETKVEHCC